jgi:hypothetical protein
MKGIVFNLLADVVSKHHGEDVWDGLLDQAGLTGDYTSLGSYPDADMEKLVTAAAQALGITPSDVQQWLGRQAMPFLVKRYPAFFAAHRETRPFCPQRQQHHSSGSAQDLSWCRSADIRFPDW